MHNVVQYYECPLLNIGQRKGNWGYIDFIDEREMRQSAVMKGQDCIGRPFLVIKAEFVLAEGETLPVFATLFQKYVNNKNIWQCFNYPGMEFLQTSYIDDGYPVDSEQIALLNELLREKRIDLPREGLFSHKLDVVALQLRTDRRNSFI